ncbi:C-type lectin 37Da-like [Atheta coriaria]|uniref:C-type lectin 37Da-like n=1 Tax=Dalotia coriaria TaxID=877792 RepID=UPI0031F42E1A
MRALSLFTFVFCFMLVNSIKNYYIFKINKLNWHAAFQDCLTRNLQLATITCSEEQTAIDDVINKTGVTNEWLWTSGTDQGEEGNFFWMSTGKPITFSKWSHPQPDNAGGRENCINLWNTDGVFTWNDWGCDNKLYYICEDTPETNCGFNLDVRMADV